MEYQNGGLNTGAYLGVTNIAKTAQSSLLEEATKVIGDATDRIRALASAARLCADATFGQQPESENTTSGQPQPPASGRAEALRRATQELHAAILTAQGQVSRFGQL